MSLSTVNEKNVPTTRVVLLKQFSNKGFIFILIITVEKR